MATNDTDGCTAFVDAPSGLMGFCLVLRLHGWRARNTQAIGGRWTVEVPMSDPAEIPAVIDRVQGWLRRERIAETSVAVGEQVYRVGVDSELPAMAAEPEPTRASVAGSQRRAATTNEGMSYGQS